MPEISPKALRDWVAFVAALLALASLATRYMISVSPNSPTVALMQGELTERIKVDSELQNLFNGLDKKQAVMEKDFERRLESLERDRERR